MAGTTATVRSTGGPSALSPEMEVIRQQINAIVLDLETMRAGVDAVCDILDADAGVTATNTAATFNMATAAALTAASVGVVV